MLLGVHFNDLKKEGTFLSLEIYIYQ